MDARLQRDACALIAFSLATELLKRLPDEERAAVHEAAMKDVNWKLLEHLRGEYIDDQMKNELDAFMKAIGGMG
jgi:hypothetical protein